MMLADLFNKKEKKQSTGAQAEAQAQKYLENHGLRLQSRNYRCKFGEIDLIMQDGNTLVFIEVRFRKSNRFGSAIETVTLSKQRKILTTAQHYLQEKQLGANYPIRFDVVGANDQSFDWIKAAF